MKRRKPYTEDELAEIAARYSVMKEFREKERSAYDAILHRNLLDKLCGHMRRAIKDKYTDEELAEIALQYDTIKELAQNEGSAYTIICSRGLQDKLFAHMKLGHARKNSKERLAAIAAKYDNINDFSKKEPKIYAVIKKRGYIRELCAHMKRGHRDNFSEEELAEIASRYDTLQEFKKNDYSVLVTIRTRGLFDKLCGHLEFGHSRKRSEEELADIASRYDNIKDLREKEHSIYVTIRERGLLDKLCGHMKRAGNLSKRKIYVFTFSDGYAYVGLTQNVKRRYSEHVTGKRKKTPIYKHIRETGATFSFEILTDWLDIDTVGRMENEYIKKYAYNGWKMLNKARGGGLGGTPSKLQKYITNQHLRIIAACTSRSELYQNYPTTYRWAVRNHCLDEYFPKRR